jgi:hypothetical protein
MKATTATKIMTETGAGSPLALPPIPPPPYIVHEASVVTVTPNGLEAISAWAMRGKTKGAIAGELGIAGAVFEKLLGKPDAEPISDVRLAWERGRAANKSALLEKLFESAMSGNTIAGFFLLKADHQMRDQGPQVTIDNSPKITLSLPGPDPDMHAYMKRIGQEKVIDGRSTENIIHWMREDGKTDAEINDYLRSIGRGVEAGPLPELPKL